MGLGQKLQEMLPCLGSGSMDNYENPHLIKIFFASTIKFLTWENDGILFGCIAFWHARNICCASTLNHSFECVERFSFAHGNHSLSSSSYIRNCELSKYNKMCESRLGFCLSAVPGPIPYFGYVWIVLCADVIIITSPLIWFNLTDYSFWSLSLRACAFGKKRPCARSSISARIVRRLSWYGFICLVRVF